LWDWGRYRYTKCFLAYFNANNLPLDQLYELTHRDDFWNYLHTTLTTSIWNVR